MGRAAVLELADHRELGRFADSVGQLLTQARCIHHLQHFVTVGGNVIDRELDLLTLACPIGTSRGGALPRHERRGQVRLAANP